MSPAVTRFRLTPDSSRVITRFFGPGDLKRSRDIVKRVQDFPEVEIEERLAELERTFGAHHPDLSDVFEAHFQQIQTKIPIDSSLSRAKRCIIGACFTMEYAVESVALFNPSIVPALNQYGVPAGSIRFLMRLRRIDNESPYFMESDDILVWDQARVIEEPKFLWQVMQIGNCGSPIETEAGWLLLTHGVGPMRPYCIGATLLDLYDPCRIIGQTREPLIMPTDEERTGYVPNVVYSFGALLHERMLIIPYSLSDLVTSVARIDLDDLLRSLVPLSMAISS